MKLAIFDFDGTLFMEETLPYLLKYWSKNGYPKLPVIKTYAKILGLFIIYKSKLNPNMDKEKFRGIAAKYFVGTFKGLNEEELTDFFKKAASDMVDHFNQPVVERVKLAKEQGFHTVICSGNYKLSLNEISKYVPFDTIIGTELTFDSKGILEIDKPIHVVTGIKKPSALLEVFKDKSINWEDSYSYGDSYYDFDILTLTGHSVAVSPDEDLKKIAIEKGWEII